MERVRTYANSRTGGQDQRVSWEVTVLIRRCGYYVVESDELLPLDIVDADELGPMVAIECLVSNDTYERATQPRLRYQRHAVLGPGGQVVKPVQNGATGSTAAAGAKA